MIRTTTLEKLRCAIRWRVGVEGVQRHEDGDINAAINRAIQRFREAVTLRGEPYFLQRYDTTVAAGASSGLPYRTIATSTFPTACLRIYAVEIVRDGRTITLEPVTFSARNDYHDLETDTAVPRSWTHLDAETIAVMPAPDQSYSARIWYLPPHTEVSRNADLVEVLTGGDDWLILDGAVQLLQRDSKPDIVQLLMADRDRIMAELMSNLSKLQKAGPTVRRDTRGFWRRQKWNAKFTR